MFFLAIPQGNSERRLLPSSATFFLLSFFLFPSLRNWAFFPIVPLPIHDVFEIRPGMSSSVSKIRRLNVLPFLLVLLIFHPHSESRQRFSYLPLFLSCV